ncbi:hypothetical protein NGRA_0438 [Nosema granulosis]|uniref:Uncharacterized protein n=1 Tax=Nosema granulosis TaxID=83296 RepID=A0A9P6L055_9MICR|nr:hypothetical protein NGRA_0438 [Nosema granulosis]
MIMIFVFKYYLFSTTTDLRIYTIEGNKENNLPEAKYDALSKDVRININLSSVPQNQDRILHYECDLVELFWKSFKSCVVISYGLLLTTSVMLLGYFSGILSIGGVISSLLGNIVIFLFVFWFCCSFVSRMIK